MPGKRKMRGKAEATEQGHPPRSGDWFEEKDVDPLRKEDRVGTCNSDLLICISRQQLKLLRGRPTMLSLHKVLANKTKQ
jgi:hypothetical protein